MEARRIGKVSEELALGIEELGQIAVVRQAVAEHIFSREVAGAGRGDERQGGKSCGERKDRGTNKSASHVDVSPWPPPLSLGGPADFPIVIMPAEGHESTARGGEWDWSRGARGFVSGSREQVRLDAPTCAESGSLACRSSPSPAREYDRAGSPSCSRSMSSSRDPWRRTTTRPIRCPKACCQDGCSCCP